MLNKIVLIGAGIVGGALGTCFALGYKTGNKTPMSTRMEKRNAPSTEMQNEDVPEPQEFITEEQEHGEATHGSSTITFENAEELQEFIRMQKQHPSLFPIFKRFPLDHVYITRGGSIFCALGI